MELKVQSLGAEDTWKDIVRIKKRYRKDRYGKHVPRGTICLLTLGENSKWVVVHGREPDDPVIQMDLTVRLALEVVPERTYDFTLEKLSWIRTLWFPWKTSDPIYRVPAQLSLISLFLGLFLGIVGILVGVVPIYQEWKKQRSAPQSIESSTTPTPVKATPAAK